MEINQQLFYPVTNHGQTKRANNCG